ncbi:MAG TPA: 16S rRNA (guanine(966)-N(2))-methyltransferase RsmD [Phycisphaerae bacterium]|nr:16S rRNA (guanine(966)-N(2))-methyltransferase RsmD [Phycisphaerae bacterium]
MPGKTAQPSLRIGAGSMRGRKLLPPPGGGTRPITGMVKKSLFSMLSGRLNGATVLDLYCGTGTLGLEALSGGGRRCFFAERDRAVLARLRRNIDACDVADAAAVWAGDIESRLGEWLDQPDAPVDLAFVDPPYDSARRWVWEKITKKIFAPLAEVLADDGLVILRLPDDLVAPERLGRLHLQRRREYGGMVVAFYGLEKADS